MKNYYQILGILDDAEDIIIRAAYKALAQKYHPDKWEGDEKDANSKMSEINEAYEVLSHKDKRARYDAEYFSTHQRNQSPNYESSEQATTKREENSKFDTGENNLDEKEKEVNSTVPIKSHSLAYISILFFNLVALDYYGFGYIISVDRERYIDFEVIIKIFDIIITLYVYFVAPILDLVMVFFIYRSKNLYGGKFISLYVFLVSVYGYMLFYDLGLIEFRSTFFTT